MDEIELYDMYFEALMILSNGRARIKYFFGNINQSSWCSYEQYKHKEPV